ncbi:DUF485 domain-containing protein (plasmid) [Roseomonas sp. OT10]|uniref:DUF485 domain-containing protein n=1 Tax=Roseomonas cutis TaxID=2897332 RepID=UPI001E502288|nr:DUF485 domain-containing protein [Roseomonas sp. OT10]UFN51550.1 DUF485 domain-containing protein [Roseomonas sp. OT10]
MNMETRPPPAPLLLSDEAVQRIAGQRRLVAFGLAGLLMLAWMAFILLVAYAKPTLATEVMPGMSLGILAGLGVMAVAWLLTCLYMLWAERWLDVVLAGRGRTLP